MAVEAVTGSRTVWHCENDPAASRLLAHRFPGVPNHGDITTVDWVTVEPVDILTGGFPCQEVSHAGKRAGLHPGTRSGLWSHMAYAVSQLRPAYVVAENVRGLLSAEAHSDVEPCPWCLGDRPGEPAVRALGAVLADLADLGYDARWHGLRASDVGAAHPRFRVFVLAVDAARRRVGASASDTAHVGHEWDRSAWWRWAGSPDRCEPAVDATGDGRYEGRTEPARQLGRPDVAGRRPAVADPDSDGLQRLGRVDTIQHADGRSGEGIAWGAPEPAPPEGGVNASATHACGCAAWGRYASAIHRWELILGRVAPPATEPGPKGNPRLSPRAVEFMMGLPEGWVTDVPGISRNDQLKMLGNGVVPQQAIEALRLLFADGEVGAA